MITPDSRPVLYSGCRLVFDEVRGQYALLHPEGVLLLNETAGAILLRCDGQRKLSELAADLGREYADPGEDIVLSQVIALLSRLAADHLVADVSAAECGASASPPRPPERAPDPGGQTPGPARSPLPLGVLAELTYRCPLQCGYCSNPLELASYQAELTTGQWKSVIEQARSLGALQFHLSGGSPWSDVTWQSCSPTHDAWACMYRWSPAASG